MIRKSTALIAVLVMLCIACNQGDRPASQNSISSMPPPPKSPSNTSHDSAPIDKLVVQEVTTSKFTPPVIAKDEEIKQENMNPAFNT
jgi:hypothetical protein